MFAASAFTGCASNPVIDKAPPKDLSEERQPNIIIILADDMGYGDIGANGAMRISTPNLDGLAAVGVNLTQFYASANICTPSRAGLMTGRYPIKTGLGYNVVTARDEHGLPAEEETIGELVKRKGYNTKFIGKWHLGKFPEHSPLKHGFDEFYGVPHSNDMPYFALYRGNEKIEEPVEQATLTQRYTSEAIDFVEKSKDRPFLIFLSHTMPHIPLFVSEAFAGQSDAGLYGDVIEELDASIGDLLAALDEQAIRDNTLIIFTSDNGPFFEGSVSGLKGGKGSTWEGAYRIPMIVHWPNGDLRKGDRNQIAMNIDILPTIASIIGEKPVQPDLDGKSLMLVLRRNAESSYKFLYFFNNEDVVGVRTRKWKFLTHAYYRRSLGAFQKFDQLDGFNGPYDLLYDAGGAGGEEYSLADRHPETVRALKKEIERAQHLFNAYRTHQPDETFPK